MLILRRWSVRRAAALGRLYRWGARWLPRLAPLVRGLGPERSERWLRPLERSGKGLFFDCRMCGQCVLGHTGMACPMNCAKQLRNGPCGGVRADGGCEVNPSMRCVWLEAGEGRRRADGSAQAPWLPPLDHRRAGKSTWIRVIAPDPQAPEVAGERASFVTVEVAPPDSANPARCWPARGRFRAGGRDQHHRRRRRQLPHVQRCRCIGHPRRTRPSSRSTRSPAATATASRSRATCSAPRRWAWSNMLCLTGDDVSQGDHPQAKPVFDLDAVSLLHIARGMCDRGEYASGRRCRSSRPVHRRHGQSLRAALRRPCRQPRKENRWPEPASSRPSSASTWTLFDHSCTRCAGAACIAAPTSWSASAR
jgi:methylenetetrahydrofolate reductase (NADPH)